MSDETTAEIPWYEMPHGMDREMAKYNQCEEPGDCDHDHDCAIEHMRETELDELHARAEKAEAERDAARAELEQLRAGLRDEWATRDGGHIDEANIYATKAEAFAALYSGEDVVHRRTGDWIAVGGRVAADAPGTALSATETDAGLDSGHGEGSNSRANPERQTEPHESHLIGWDGPIAQLDITWAPDPDRPGNSVRVGATWGRQIAEAAKQIVTGNPTIPTRESVNRGEHTINQYREHHGITDAFPENED